MKKLINCAFAVAAMFAVTHANAGIIVQADDVTDIPGAVQPPFLGGDYIGVGNTVAGGNSNISISALPSSTPQPVLDLFADGNGFGVPHTHPGGEAPPRAFDNDPSGGSKYLNFGGENSGLVVNFSFPTRITGLRFRYGNDAPERDPDTFTLEGTNSPNPIPTEPDWSTLDANSPTLQDDAIALLEQNDGGLWTLVADGSTNLVNPSDTFNDALQSRDMFQDELPFQRPGPTFQNDDFYTSYRILFPTIRFSPFGNNIMQIGEIELIGEIMVPEPTTVALLLCSVGSMAVIRRR